MNTVERPKAHPHVAAVLAEAKAPKHAAPKDVAAQLRPILALATDVQKQIAEHRAHLHEAQLSDPGSDGDMERLHQTLRAMETDVAGLITAAQRIRVSILQYARYANEIEQRYEASP